MDIKEETQGGGVVRALAFLVGGVAVGSALGMLFAPKSGKETRQDILDWLKERREMGDALRVKKEQIAHALAAGRKAYREDKTPTHA